MSDEEQKPMGEILHKGHLPLKEGWIPGVRGGYQPETSEAGPPPSGGSGAKEPEKDEKK